MKGNFPRTKLKSRKEVHAGTLANQSSNHHPTSNAVSVAASKSVLLQAMLTEFLRKDVILAAAQITYDTELMLLEAIIKQLFKSLNTYMSDVNRRTFGCAYL